MADNCVIVFVKYPVPGQVKTRLAKSIGDEAVAGFYKCCVEDVIAGIKDVYSPVHICYDPSSTREMFSGWLGKSFTYFPQRGEDLGEKMKNAFEDVFKAGFVRAILIGSDIPDLPADFIKKAISAQAQSGAVIGPSSDGGYYLIGFNKDDFLPEAFNGISWSTDAVLKQTTDILSRHKRTFSLLPEWHDIDTIEDVRVMMLRNRNAAFGGSRTMGFCRKRKLGPDKNLAKTGL
jgi:uncharacterized protein